MFHRRTRKLNKSLYLSVNVFSVEHTFQIELEFGNVGLFRRGENRSTRRKTTGGSIYLLGFPDENQHTYDAESGDRTRATLMGGEWSHHCAIPAPPPISSHYIDHTCSSYVD